MEQPDRIHLRDYILTTEIGAFQTERGHDQRLRFNIEVELATHVMGVNDDVDRILSYDILTGAVAKGLADRRYDLLETLAEKIAAQILAHPRAAQVSVTVEKLDRIPGALGVTLVRKQARVEADETAAPIRVVFCGAGMPRPDIAVPGHGDAGGVALVPDDPGLPLPQGGNAREVALLALDQAAWALAGHLGLTVADSLTELDWAAAEARAVVWAPSRMVRDVAGLPPEPRALALWLADRLGASRLDWALADGTDMPAVPASFDVPMGRL